MRTAFKEWAVVVDALGRGEQILILRKGGINEGRAGFQVEHDQFLLFPTLFHQQREAVTPAAQARWDEAMPFRPPPEIVCLQFLAQVTEWHRLDSLEMASRLRGQHIWRDTVIAQRFDWGKARNIFALALRVFRLLSTVELPMRPDYGGCKSWIELSEDVPTEGAVPVLDDATFAQRVAAFRSALAVTSVPPAIESGAVQGPPPIAHR